MSVLRSNRGFTLVEALVALSIFAVLAVVSYGVINELGSARETVAQETMQWRRITRLIERIESDITNVAPRPVRNQFGGDRPPLDATGDGSFRLSRFPNPWDTRPTASIRRIGYRREGKQLYYQIWPALDSAGRQEPASYLLFDNVTTWETAFLDSDHIWQNAWNSHNLPLAVRVRISFGSGEEITRMIALKALLDQAS